MAPVGPSVYGHIVLGMASVVVYMVGLFKTRSGLTLVDFPIRGVGHNVVAVPLWAGVFVYMLTGIIGLRSNRMRAYALMSILAALVALGQLVFEALVASCTIVGYCEEITFSIYMNGQRTEYSRTECTSGEHLCNAKEQVPLQICISLAAGVGGLEMLVALFAARYSLCDRSQTNAVV